MKTTRFTGRKWPALLGLFLLAVPAARAQFGYVTNNGTIIITAYTGPGGPVTIPDTINGLSVTAIVAGPTFENKGITSIAIPASVTNIQTQFAPNNALTAFTVDTNNPAYSSAGGVLFDKTRTTLVEYPPGLSGSYVIPGTVTNIGNNAFVACYYLSGVTISNTVVIIGAEAFGFCFSLTNVTIPASVASIGPDVFINCTNLPAITVDPGNSFYSSVGGVLFDKNQTTLVAFPNGRGGSYAIPNGVVTIGVNAFILCNGLTNVTMPGTVTTLDDGAFADCSGLTNITLGAGVNQIATSAFAGCNNLTAINVDPANPVLSSVNGVVYNQSQTALIKFPPGFPGNYTTPGSVTSIAPYAAEDCNLSGLTLAAGVTNIGDLALQGCGHLTNVTMLSPVIGLGIFTFADCPKLVTVTIYGGVSSFGVDAFVYCTSLSGLYFIGNASAAPDPSAFIGDTIAVVYYLAGTTGWSSSFGGLPTMELQPVAIAANPTNGPVPLTVSFTAAAMDNGGNPVTNWNWYFGDGTTSTAQNPSHTYTVVGTFTAAVVETNSGGIPAAGAAAIIQSTPPRPGIRGLGLSGSNLVLDATNGLSGRTYYVLASTNIALPLSQWPPAATNNLSTNGNFTITISNTFVPALPQQFFVLKTQ